MHYDHRKEYKRHRRRQFRETRRNKILTIDLHFEHIRLRSHSMASTVATKIKSILYNDNIFVNFITIHREEKTLLSRYYLKICFLSMRDLMVFKLKYNVSDLAKYI